MRNTFPLLEKGKSRIYQDPVKFYLLALSRFKAGNKSAPKIPMLVWERGKLLRRGQEETGQIPTDQLTLARFGT